MVGWTYKALHASVTPWHNRLFVRMRVSESLPHEGAAVIVGNHSSLWDPVALCCCSSRPIRWFGKKEVYVGPGKWFFHAVGAIPVDRSRRNPEAFEMACDALRRGALVGLFPEGTRHVGEGIGPVRPGAARLALETRAPVVPVGLASDKFWPKDRKVPRLNQRIFISVGEPLHIKGDPTNADDIKQGMATIVDAIKREAAVAKAARDAPTAEWRAP